jgi:hypothetical protein
LPTKTNSDHPYLSFDERATSRSNAYTCVLLTHPYSEGVAIPVVCLFHSCVTRHPSPSLILLPSHCHCRQNLKIRWQNNGVCTLHSTQHTHLNQERHTRIPFENSNDQFGVDVSITPNLSPVLPGTNVKI